MATITFKGSNITTVGELPKVGEQAPDFTLTNDSLQDVSMKDFAGKRLVLNIFPSIDTGICALSAKHFNGAASELDNTVVMNVSKDLPFAQKRFCGAEGLENVKKRLRIQESRLFFQLSCHHERWSFGWIVQQGSGHFG